MSTAVRAGLAMALLALGAGWWWWSADDEIAPPTALVAAGPTDHRAGESEAGPAPLRVAAPLVARGSGPAAAVIPPQAGMARAVPFRITAAVLDDADQPVEGAIVELWEADWERRPPTEGDPRDVAWLGTRRGAALASIVTDAEGLCVCDLEREFAYATARHPQYGRSIARAVGRGALGSDHRMQLWLLRPVVVRGTVIAADGTPVPHAIVMCNQGDHRGKLLPTGRITASASGRFEFEVAKGSPCSVGAQAGGEASVTVVLVAREDVEVVVPFPGALCVRGCVRNAVGVPVAGARVEIAGEQVDKALVALPEPRCTTDARGEFAVSLSTCGRLLVVASDPGRPELGCALHEVVVSREERSPFVELVLGQHPPLRGTMVKADGSPAVGARVSLTEDREPHGWQRWAEVSADGTFAMGLPPRSMVRVAAPNVEEVTVPGDAQSVRLVQRPAQHPIMFWGEVLDAEGGPAKDFALHWVRVSASGDAIGGATVAGVERTGNTFRFTAPWPGADWYLVAKPRAKQMPHGIAGPFAAMGAQHATIQLPRTGRVKVRLRTGGLPARGLEVSVVHRSSHRTEQQRVDAAGAAHFDDLWPGPSMIVVTRGPETVATQATEPHPGDNPEIVIDVTL